MRKLVIAQNVTVDGSVEMLENWFDVQGQGDVCDLMEENRRQRSQADALLVGRTTFLDLRGYWRDLDDDATGNSDYLNGVEKYVVSRTITDPDWPRTTILDADPIEDVRSLKQRSGRDIVLTGSISLAHPLIEAGLVDEFRLFVYPFVQGRGRRLFPDGQVPTGLRQLSARSFGSGVVLLTYGAT